MGDRGNIVVDGVYLYSHWTGSNLPKVLQDALAKRWRWTDGSYLCRIVFDCMTEKAHGDETGFGISTHIGDNSHPILHVSTDSQTVTLKTEDGATLASWTFAVYCLIQFGELDQFAVLHAGEVEA
jgi:hypothetical protein